MLQQQRRPIILDSISDVTDVAKQDPRQFLFTRICRRQWLDRPSTTVSLTLIDDIAAGTSKEFFDDRRSQAVAQCSDGVGHVTLRALGCREVCNLGVGESLLIEKSFF